jgi:hypothetical protein
MTEEQKQEMQGAFVESLKRNNKQIRDDRAEAITENAQMLYRRAIEDMKMELKQMKRDRENMLDLSPDHGMSLKLASDFNAAAYVTKDVELGVKIRNLEIKLDLSETQYKRLFVGGA